MSALRTITLGVVALVLAVLVIPTAARADINVDLVQFNTEGLQYTYTKLPVPNGNIVGYIDIRDRVSNAASIAITSFDSGVQLQKTYIYNSGTSDNFDFFGHFDIHYLGTPGQYTATGSVKFTDTDKSTNAFEAAFTSYMPNSPTRGVSASTGGLISLHINGMIGLLDGNTSILINRPNSGSWTFVGNQMVPDSSVTVSAPPPLYWFYDGESFATEINVPSIDLDVLFGGGLTTGNASALGYTNAVPVPAALVLGLMGLGTLGLWMRRYA